MDLTRNQASDVFPVVRALRTNSTRTASRRNRATTALSGLIFGSFLFRELSIQMKRISTLPCQEKELSKEKKSGFCTRKTMKNERRRCRIPRMSKKRKEEWALFLNDRNRITYNKLCVQCEHECKQSFRATVIYCPKYSKKEKVNGRIKNHQSK